MKWYENKDKFTSSEKIILSILTLNEDPKKVWVKYTDVISMSTVSESEFQIALQSLLQKKIVRMGDQGNGLSLALEEKIEFMMNDKLNEVLEEIEKEIQEAIQKGDFDLADDLQQIIEEKKK